MSMQSSIAEGGQIAEQTAPRTEWGIDLRIATKVLEVVDAGLVSGVGKPIPGQMCVEAACREYHDNLESLSSEERRSMVALMAGYWNAIWESLYEPQTQETKDG
jgi:hypothetical protein